MDKRRNYEKRKTAQNRPLFRTHKSVSVEEIMAAGGPTIYGIKSGKTSENLLEAMKYAPAAEPFTEEEWLETLKQLRESK